MKTVVVAVVSIGFNVVNLVGLFWNANMPRDSSSISAVGKTESAATKTNKKEREIVKLPNILRCVGKISYQKRRAVTFYRFWRRLVLA